MSNCYHVWFTDHTRQRTRLLGAWTLAEAYQQANQGLRKNSDRHSAIITDDKGTTVDEILREEVRG